MGESLGSLRHWKAKSRKETREKDMLLKCMSLSIMEKKSFMRRSAPLLCHFSSSNVWIEDLVAEVAVA